MLKIISILHIQIHIKNARLHNASVYCEEKAMRKELVK